jgi:hypothetical protein
MATEGVKVEVDVEERQALGIAMLKINIQLLKMVGMSKDKLISEVDILIQEEFQKPPGAGGGHRKRKSAIPSERKRK